jgi:hypothetical protein
MVREIEFRIDAWTPETIPQERLGAYLVELAKLYGEAGSVQFKKLKKGSAVLVSVVQETVAPKVERRLTSIRSGEAPKDVVDAYRRIDDMLADDNAIGLLKAGAGCEVIKFPSLTRPKPVEYAAVHEDGFIEGEIIRIGGKDRTIHITLQDGDTVYANIDTNRDTARELGRHLFGPIVRLWGQGTWRRASSGDWQIERFQVNRFEVLTERNFAAALPGLQAIEGSRWNLEADPVAAWLAIRRDEAAPPRKRNRKSN